MIKKFLLPLAFCIMLTLAAFATEAADISGEVNITAENLQKSVMLDRKITTASSGEDVTITLESQVPMGGVWLRYSAAPIGAALDGKPISENGFFSEYIELGGKKSAVFTFEAVTICEFYVYSEGVLPSEVQLWEVGQNETDLMLFAAHSDDDQLFFAGLIPYYIARDDVDVKVCFLTTPYQDISRVQELLAGLWHCGLKTYPTILTLPDDWSESFDEAKRILERRGHSYDEISATVRDVLNTYKPQVLVLHDFKGEYGHGMHIFATNTIIDTIENAAEGDFVPNKIYVHLYKQNEIILPIDDPLDFFGGKSAFNVSQEAFRYHKSQHWTWFYGWIYGDNGETTKASQIRYCSPQKYGLYYSSEGADTGNDMLENIETYAAKREREEAERQAEESRLAEEAALTSTAALETTSVEAEPEEEQKNFPVAALIPILAAMIIAIFAISISLKKRKV